MSGNNSEEVTETFERLFKPRSAMARALYDKMYNDKNLEQFDKSKWYQCDPNLLSKEAQALFVNLNLDAETTKFINDSCEKSNWIFTQMWHTLASAVLSWFMTRTSINGLLGRGSMFVFSKEQFDQLVPDLTDLRPDRLLDLGAGDGKVTDIMAPYFNQTFATEISSTMRRQLMKKGYKVLDINVWQEEAPYDMITCLNVLDRCSRPVSLLHDIRDSLKPNTGRAIIALVLPFQPYVETGSSDHRPEEYLPITGLKVFESQVTSAIEMFNDAGFEVEKWSRLPYLCEGDMGQSFYWLDDAIFVLKPLA